MKTMIQATVNYGRAHITQSWEFVKFNGVAYIVLHEADDGRIVIPLAENNIKDMPKDISSPRKVYKGTLQAAEAIRMEPDSKTSISSI